MRRQTDQTHKMILILPLLLIVATFLFYGGAIAGEEINPAQLAQRYANAYEKVVKEAEARGVVPDIKGDLTLQAMGQELERTLHEQPEEVKRAVSDELQKRLDPLLKAAAKLFEQKRLADEQREREYLRNRSQRPAVSLFSKDETVAERFEQAMKKKAEYCATHKIDPANRRCDILKLKPADPLATEEGRFAHLIKIPNPVPVDSGYKPGMTSEQYFDHLCKTEAGEFIYKTVENVEGIYMMRPRKSDGNAGNHLYALEDPYGDGLSAMPQPEDYFVQPAIGKYKFIELPNSSSDKPTNAARYRRYYRDPNAHPSREYITAIDGREVRVPYVVTEKGTDTLQSRYGFTWRGITRPHDREHGIGGGEIIVVDLQMNEILAVRRGFVLGTSDPNLITSFSWATWKACPGREAKSDYVFLKEVLKPVPDQSIGGGH